MARVHPDARVARITMVTAHMVESLRFYRDVLGLSVLEQSGDAALLGSGHDGFLTLLERPKAKPHPHATGLYHFALLVPSRADLGNTLFQLRRVSYPLQGAADHLVSEALYLADEEGNGIEVYRDRPRAEWPRLGSQVRMDTLPLDLRRLLEDSTEPDTRSLPHGTTLGHIHLRVSDVGRAETFYRDVLGFDLTLRIGQDAAFFSAGGYHHHIGVNTWSTRGAEPAPAGGAGLHSYTIVLPTRADVEHTVGRLAERQHPVHETDGTFSVRDPAGIQVVLTHPPLPGLPHE